MRKDVATAAKKVAAVILACGIAASLSPAAFAQGQAADASGAAATGQADQSELDALLQTIEAAQAGVNKAKNEVDAAQAELAAAEDAAESARAAFDKGSFGFFEYVGATNALNILTNSTYASYTVKRDPNDATSLDNMRASIAFIKECNELRANNGLAPLKVTYDLMAMAQADANYSDKIIGHARQFNVGENLAWTYGSDPFPLWYDDEKALYDAGEREFQKIGHYLNIIKPSYTTTGFAICTRGSNKWTTYSQTFLFSDGMDVDDFEAEFEAYYQAVTGEMDAAEANVVDAKAKLDAANFAYDDSLFALSEAQAAYDPADSDDPEDLDNPDNSEDPVDLIESEEPEKPQQAGTWIQDGGRWWYRHADGSYTKNGWEYVDGAWYRFDYAGWMQTGWVQDGDKWYYLQGSGVMATGWIIDGSWYYLGADGAMRTGWLSDGGAWYYLQASGAMKTGWLDDGGNWYYLTSTGAMATGWIAEGGTWYYLQASGAMAIGWFQDSGAWYYAYSSGAMAHGCWVGDYYLTSSGAMATNAWIGAYYVGADGKWQPMS